MIKMVVTDIDGTIYTPEKGMSTAVKECLKNLTDEGVLVVIATGRTYASARYMADMAGIRCPLVGYQGGIICSYSGDILKVKYLDSDIAKDIINDFRKRKIHINVYVADKLYVENDDEYIKDYIGDKGIDYFKVDSFDKLDLTKLNKILAINYNPEFINNLINELKNKYPMLYIVKSHDYFCEIANKEATKGNAVKFFAQKYNIAYEEILAIGDQNNDIEMVKTAGIGIAMGNGTAEIKEAADYVTDTVQNDGFVKAINKFVWGK